MQHDINAIKKWNKIEKQYQIKILTNIHCGQCGLTEILSYSINDLPKTNDFILTGKCKICGKKICRVVEQE